MMYILIVQGNIAYGKSATASGVYWASTDIYQPNKAVDGNADSNVDSGHCFHCVGDPSKTSWWRVDLGGLHMVYNVTLYNRIGGKQQ